MTTILECSALTKSFGKLTAVKSLDLQVKPGEIYAFCGLNGAGKTTTIRAILGMIRPTSGAVHLFGEPISPFKQSPWQRVGYLVEKPAAYPDLTVFENLEITRHLQQYSEPNASLNVIEKLALTDYAHRKAGTLSTGNLQRLGLARALLHQPDLLILDEPANGLDPAGVVEIRHLLLRLAVQQGVTIFLSSHILAEVDRLATRIGIIHRGVLIEELDQRQLEHMRSPILVIQSRSRDKAVQALTSAGYNPKSDKDCIILENQAAIQSPDQIAALLVYAGAAPTSLTLRKEDLETHFLRLTGAQP